MIRTIIADDYKVAREELAHLLREAGDFSVVGEAQQGTDVLPLVEKYAPDVVFLDIEMPGKSGIEAAFEIVRDPKAPVIVFVTGHHEYAIKAFEANAVDYVLKPIDFNRFQTTIERVRERLKAQNRNERFNHLEADLAEKGVVKKIAAHSPRQKDRILLEPSEIYFFDSKLSESFAHLEKEEYVVNQTLTELLSRLDPKLFAQIHRSYLVNLSKIVKISPLFNGSFEVHLSHPTVKKLPLSRRFAKALKSSLGKW